MIPAVEELALTIFVPQAESFVRSFREHYDVQTANDIPAHITINTPFVPDLKSESELDESLEDLFSGIAAFPFALTEIRRFPNVLYLAPEPEERFRELTTAVVERFPESPPYEGEFDSVIPHLTVVHLQESEALSAMSSALAAAAEGVLPITGEVTYVSLIEKVEGEWRIRRSFRLGNDVLSDS